jgi:hypothetical protein
VTQKSPTYHAEKVAEAMRMLAVSDEATLKEGWGILPYEVQQRILDLYGDDRHGCNLFTNLAKLVAGFEKKPQPSTATDNLEPQATLSAARSAAYANLALVRGVTSDGRRNPRD